MNHFRSSCPHPIVPRAPAKPVNQPGRYVVSLDFDDSIHHVPVWVSTLASSRCQDSPGKFLSEGFGILDSACSATVAGSIWIKSYIAALPADSRNLVTSRPIRHSFAFGRDIRVATSSVSIPEWSLGRLQHLTVAVLDELPSDPYHIPLLLSRRWQQDNGLVIDHCRDDVLVDCVRAFPDTDQRDFVHISGRRVALRVLGSTGHHALQLLPVAASEDVKLPGGGRFRSLLHQGTPASVCAVSPAALDVPDQPDLAIIKSEVSRLHMVYGHPPSSRLVSVLTQAGIKDPDVLAAAADVASKCLVCRSHGRPDPRPRACIPLSLHGEFNLWVSIDLSMFEQRWRLNIICMGTRFMRSRFLSSKSSASVITALELEWTSFFGPMRHILSDAGGEFTGDEFRRFCEVNNIILHTTAAESQFGNGIVERHGGLLSDVMKRMRCDLPQTSSEVLLAKALLVHNDTATVDGTSPMQRLVGRRARLPSVLVDDASGMAPIDGDIGPHVAHLEALNAARIAFSQAQASSSLKAALASRMHSSSRRVYHLDDQVFFFDASGKSKTSGWRGPGTVTGFSPAAKMVTIQYGGQRYMRHTSKVRSWSDPELAGPHAGSTVDGGAAGTNAPATNVVVANLHVPVGRGYFEVHGVPADVDEVAIPDADLQEPDLVAEPHQDQELVAIGPGQLPDDPVDDHTPESTDGSGSDSEPLPDFRQPASIHPSIPLLRRSGRRRPGQAGHHEANIVHTLLEGSSNSNTTTNAGRQPDQRGRELPDLIHSGHSLEDSTNAADATQVLVNSREVPPSEQGPEFLEAKLREIADIHAHDAVSRLDAALLPPEAQIIDTRFVCEFKTRPDGSKSPKARLVAKGFQESIGTDPVDAPTVTRTGVRLLLLHASRARWKTTCIDYKRAFLQARDRNPNDPVLAVVPPPEAAEPPGSVWVLKKSLYGLRSAPREWWLTLLESLLSVGFTQSAHDPAIFVYRDPVSSGAIIGLLALHVDDMLAAGSPAFDSVLATCESMFRVGSKSHNDFVYLGVEISTEPNGDIALRQSRYISAIRFVPLPVPGQELSREVLDLLNHAVGELMWVAASTRCDIAVDAATLISELHHPSTSTIHRANKLIRYLHHTRNQPLVLSAVVGVPLEFKIYSDAALDLDAVNGKSRGGFLIAIGPAGPPASLPFPMAVIHWKSSLIHRVVTSSFSAELLTLCSCFDASIWTRDLYAEMSGSVLPIQAYVDCKSVIDSSTSLRLQATERRLTRYIWFLREALARTDVEPLLHIRTDQQIADGLTKRSPALRSALRFAMSGWGHRT